MYFLSTALAAFSNWPSKPFFNKPLRSMLKSFRMMSPIERGVNGSDQN